MWLVWSNRDVDSVARYTNVCSPSTAPFSRIDSTSAATCDVTPGSF